jgi:uncharacterized membrane protein YkoI
MRPTNCALWGLTLVLGFALAAPSAWAATPSESKKSKTELPAAVAKAVRENCPDAEMGKLEVEKEGGITLYDIEFKNAKGEIEVAEDGSVMDIAKIIEKKDLPPAAAAAIEKAAAGAQVKQLEKSEVRTELKIEGGKGTLVKLPSSKYVYEAELLKGSQKGEIQVSADGKIVEDLKWSKPGSKEGKEESEEQDQPKPAAKKK